MGDKTAIKVIGQYRVVKDHNSDKYLIERMLCGDYIRVKRVNSPEEGVSFIKENYYIFW